MNDSLGTTNARILVVDDTPANIQTLTAILKQQGYQISVATNGRQAIEVIEKVHPDLVLMDVMMPEMDGYEACRHIKASPLWRDLPIIFLSAKTETSDIVHGFELGAVDYVAKPFNAHELLARVNTHLTLQSLRRQFELRNAELARELEVAQELLTDARRRVEGPLLGDSPAIRALRESIGRQAAGDEVLLLTGPQGAGHEATARAIHHASPRSRQAFIHVNCALLPPGQDAGILSSPATTQEKTAPADAGSRMSMLELAAKGTLYLDEVHRLPTDLQERLAGVLDGIESSRERGEPSVPNVRFIAYTSAPLSTANGFHPKLLAILERRQLRVPSLAERSEDVPEIALFFVRQHARRIGAVVETISDESIKRLCKYRWPGDVGELQSLLERSVSAAREPVLEIDAALLDEGLPLGHYRLVEKLGVGGMGEVWRARHQLLARPCAVKLIRPDLLGERNREAATERFRLEAQAIARLSSQNTVRLYDFGVSETGSFYFVMELLDGMDLASLVDRFGPLPPERVVWVLRQACRSLSEAHEAGLLHRDIKPHNLFLCRLGLDYDVVKLLDFGLVKSLRDDNPNITAAGSLAGTPAYMPPERILGAVVDQRSDLYSLGCAAYWMLTGQTVFQGEMTAMLIHHTKTAPQPPSRKAGIAIPERLEQIVLGCLEKAPEKRPQSALDLWGQLGEVTFETPWSLERAESWWRNHISRSSEVWHQGEAQRTITLP
ncbi:MAG TPA: response regulator [Blastocatellia bacterium]|nr:response regulator [Blastocatellia bacterium]